MRQKSVHHFICCSPQPCGIYHCCLIAKSCPTLRDTMDCSAPGFPVLHCLLEFAQIHVHWACGCHPTISSSVSPFSALNLPQHHGVFQCVSSLHQVARVLELQLQHQSFQWISRTDLLWDGLVGSPCSPRDSQESTREGNGKSVQYSCLENPMNSMKTQKDRTVKDELPRQDFSCYINSWAFWYTNVHSGKEVKTFPISGL